MASTPTPTGAARVPALMPRFRASDKKLRHGRLGGIIEKGRAIESPAKAAALLIEGGRMNEDVSRAEYQRVFRARFGETRDSIVPDRRKSARMPRIRADAM